MIKFKKGIVKNILLVSLIIVFAFTLTACDQSTLPEIIEGDDDYEEEYPEADGVLIRGNFNISGIQAADNEEIEIGSVILIYSHAFEVIDVENDEFVLELDRENPAGIAFTDLDDNYLGYLTLEDGFDSIPSSFIDEETEEIDFGTITFDGEQGNPENNPLGEEINISQEEQDLLAASSSFFAATFRSPDVIESIVQGEIEGFSLWFMYAYEHMMQWDWDSYNRVSYDHNMNLKHDYYDIQYPFFQMHRFGVEVKGLEVPKDQVKLHYPDKWGFTDTTEPTDSPYYYHFNGIYCDHFQDAGLDIYSSYATGGKYLFDFAGEKEIEVNIPDDLYEIGKENAFIVVPTYHLTENDEGIDVIEEISWEYYTKSGRPISHDTAKSIIYSGGDNPHADHPNSIHMAIHYETLVDGEIVEDEKTIDVPVDNHSHRLEREIAWKDVQQEGVNRLVRLGISYEDLYGIHYHVSFWGYENDYYEDNQPERPAEDEEMDTFDLNLEVVDEDNNPISDAKVDLINSDEIIHTDEQGKATFSDLEPRNYDFKVMADEYENYSGTAHIVDEDLFKQVFLKEYEDVTYISEDESIQDYIDSAEPGDTIIVQQGVYSEEINIDNLDGLTFKSENPHGAELKGLSVSNSYQVTIKGFQLSNPLGHTLLLDYVVDSSLENLHISDSGVDIEGTDEGAFGIEIVDSDSIMLDNVNSSNNSWSGISIRNSGVDYIRNSRFENNNVEGLKIEDNSRAYGIDNSSFINNQVGINILDESYINAFNNNFHYNNLAGISIEHASNTELLDNNFYENSIDEEKIQVLYMGDDSDFIEVIYDENDFFPTSEIDDSLNISY